MLRRKPVNYPFEHALGELSLAEYVQPDDAKGTDNEIVRQNCSVLLGKMISLYVRTLGRLVSIAREVEDHIIPQRNADPTPVRFASVYHAGAG